MLDTVRVADLEDISDQDTDSDVVIEWGKISYIAKVFSNLLDLWMGNND